VKCSISALERKKPSAKRCSEGYVRACVRRRVDQELERKRWTAFPLGPLCDDGREVAARAVATDRETIGVGAELRGVGRRPPERGPGILGRGREGVLRGEPVVDGEDMDARVAAEEATWPVVGVEVPDLEAAAVEEDEQRVGAARLVGRVQPGAERSLGSVHAEVTDRTDAHGRTGEGEALAP
jgi:hypothetical protein